MEAVTNASLEPSGGDGFCYDPLWDTDLLISSTWPQLTACFQNTVLTYFPFLCFWLALPIHLYTLPTHQGPPQPLSLLTALKMFLSATLSMLSLVVVLEDASTGDPVSPAQYLANSIRVLSYAAVACVTYIERRRRVTTSGVLFALWTVLLLCDVVPLYTQIMVHEEDKNLVNFTIGIATFCIEMVQVVLQCIADVRDDKEIDELASPELTASYPSQIFYWWMTKTVYRGWKRDLEERDLFSLNPRDTSDALVPVFEEKWMEEVDRLDRKRRRPPFKERIKPGSLSMPHTEKQRLIDKEEVKDEPKTNYHSFGKDADGQNKGPCPSLNRVLLQITWARLLVGLVQKLISDVFLFFSPVFLSLLITYADHSDTEYAWKGYALAILMFSCQMVKSVFFNMSFWVSQIIGMQLKTTLVAAIYKKALTMDNDARKHSTAGEIVNLMSVDCQRVQDIMNFFYFAWTTPFQIVLAIIILYQYIGPSSFAGLAVLLLTVPMNSYVATVQQKLQRQNLKFKDARLRLTNEALSGMKVLKLYAWETTFKEKITQIRKEEMKVLMKIAYCNAAVSVMFNAAPYLVSLATFAVYVNVSDENVLDANKAFVALSFFNLLRVPLALLSTIISMTVQAKVSIERINHFLCTGDINPDNIQRESKAPLAIDVQKASFTWDTTGTPTLQNITLQVPEGKLFAIVGPVGSGKSSLTSALLGEMDRLSGKAVIKTKVAYVPQQAWIQNATVRDNILFGRHYNERRYRKVIQACALERDLEILTAGDMTEIGEKGINLSGGQKQRVSLARAVYSEADIYILDDPLSAVDSHVGKHIFNNVISRNGVLRKKTRVLVTHGAHWLPSVDCVVVMQEGRVRETGSYEALMSSNGQFAEFIRTYLMQIDDEEEDLDSEIAAIRNQILTDIESTTSDQGTSGDELAKKPTTRKRTRSRSAVSQSIATAVGDSSVAAAVISVSRVFDEQKPERGGKLTQLETVERGKVKLAVFGTYIRAAGPFAITLSMFMFLFFQAVSAWSNFWLTDWTGDSLLTNASSRGTAAAKDKQDYYLGIFGLFGIIQIILLTVHNIVYWIQMVAAAQTLHLGMLESILRSPMSFFDTTPLGRIMNRFSRDIEVLDNNLPIIIRDYLSSLLNCLVILLVICINTPLFLSLVIPILLFYYFIQNFYIPTSRQLKRLESVTRSPIYTHFSETITGGPTIRAYDVVPRFINESKNRVDRNQSFYYISLGANRWLGMNLEILANIVTLGAGVFAVLTPGLGGSLVGLSVSYATQVSSNLVWMVRQMSDMETNIVSVERLKEYSELDSEARWILPHRRPRPDWPHQGEVNFSDYKTRYRPGLDLVLKGISCRFKPGEKVGIVGRTGAGKSSLALALFRLIESSEGSISVDGVTISDIGLHDLRSRLTILPQDPVLFFGSLRMNLDPIDQYTDDQLWAALASAHLKDFVDSLSEGLNYQVGEEGQALSVGQRQLVCLARALLKKTKILILDEATAAVDMETDQLIQNTIRSEFEDCTIITIAHRLNTIMDYDRIMVLDAGVIQELDSPASLLANTESHFYSMAREANLI